MMKKTTLVAAAWISLVFSLCCLYATQKQTTSNGAVSLKDLPDFSFDVYQYKVDPYLRATTLQAVKKEKAVQTLRTLAHDKERGDRIIVLCRMLFTKKGKAEFRRPMIGAPALFGDTHYTDWPLEPIELVDGIPFLIERGYELAGHPEPAAGYLKYCLDNCAWNNETFQSKSQQEKQQALDKLLASPKWKRPLRRSEKDFFVSQIR